MAHTEPMVEQHAKVRDGDRFRTGSATVETSLLVDSETRAKTVEPTAETSAPRSRRHNVRQWVDVFMPAMAASEAFRQQKAAFGHRRLPATKQPFRANAKLTR